MSGVPVIITGQSIAALAAANLFGQFGVEAILLIEGPLDFSNSSSLTLSRSSSLALSSLSLIESGKLPKNLKHNELKTLLTENLKNYSWINICKEYEVTFFRYTSKRSVIGGISSKSLQFRQKSRYLVIADHHDSFINKAVPGNMKSLCGDGFGCQFQTDTFQEARIFRAGPTVRQGMILNDSVNHGISDAFNLTWKLAAVMYEAFPEEIFSTFVQERSRKQEQKSCLRCRLTHLRPYHYLKHCLKDTGHLCLLKVTDHDKNKKYLDHFLAEGFNLITYNCSPQTVLNSEQMQIWQKRGASWLNILPKGSDIQYSNELIDSTGKISNYFKRKDQKALILRPDRQVCPLDYFIS